jgi:hypothetical protein
MSINLFNNNLAGIDDLGKVTFTHAIRLSKPNKVNASLQQIATDSLNLQHDFDAIATKLDSINTSVVQYSSTTPWYKKIIHLITYLKVRSLRKSLPKLIDAVNRQAMAHFKINPAHITDNDDILSLSVPQTSPYLETYQKIKFYIENFNVLGGADPSEVVDPENPRPPRVQRTNSTIIPQKPNGLQKVAQRKWQILENVHANFLKNNPKDSWDNTARMVNDYIIGKLQIFERYGDATIPRFFHCTKTATWPLILASKSILKQRAGLGDGAFISNQDESEASASYGTHTFALTEESVFKFVGHYYNGSSCGGTANSLWIRIAKDIPVSNQSVAHFVVPTVADCEGAADKFLTKLQLDVPIITREASNMLNLLFREAIGSYDLPKTWSVHESYSKNTVISGLPYKINT